jgi:Tol biopolymer transport system component
MNYRFLSWTRASLITACSFLAVSLFAGSLQVLSVPDSGVPRSATASGDSLLPVLSPDGRYVLFASTAKNLAITPNGNPMPVLIPPRQNVYLRDRQLDTTVLVSVSQQGTEGASENCTPTGISNDGRFALFESSGVNLVPGATNGENQVFIRDMLSNATFLVSLGLNGTPANGDSRSSSMTPDGRFIAFVSEADNLTVGDTNGIPDVFVRDLQRAVTLLASNPVSTNASVRIGRSESPVLTPDGRYVVFYSTAASLGSTNGNIYVCDLLSLQTTLVSRSAKAVLQSTIGPRATPVCHSQAISDDGRYVAYVVSPVPTVNFNPGISPSSGIVLRDDLQTGLEDLVSTNCNVPTGAYQDLRILDLSSDGRFVAFLANSNGVTGNTSCVLLWDASTGVSALASGDTNNAVPAGSSCQWPVLDPTASALAFYSTATNLTTNLLAGELHLYVRDLVGQTVQMIDADASGVGSVMDPVTIPRLAAGGRLVSFESPAANLVANDRNRGYDVFVRDTASNTVELVSAPAPALLSTTPNGASAISPSSMSADGRYIAFESDAEDLVGNDTNGLRDVFVRDLVSGSNILVSVDVTGTRSGNGISYAPSISSDGRYVAFTSSSTNLVSGDTNGTTDVFVRDLQAGVTVLVTTNFGISSFNPLPAAVAISPSGQTVFFIASVNPNGGRGLFSSDLQTGAHYSMTPSGLVSTVLSQDKSFAAYIDAIAAGSGSVTIWSTQLGAPLYTNANLGASSLLAVSSDGHKVVYSTNSSQLFIGDDSLGTNWIFDSGLVGSNAGFRFSSDGRFLVYALKASLTASNQVYVYDLDQRIRSLVSHARASATPATGNSDSPTISPDGRFIAFRSDAPDLVVNDTNTVPDVFLYDRVTQASTILTASRAAARSADNRSLAPQFSGDGHTLLLQSLASDLTAQDFNGSQDLFAFTLLSTGISSMPALGPGFWLNWPSVPGRSYRVQVTDDLQNPVWINATGTITNLGITAYFSDLAPPSGHRFYRITELQ